MDGSQQAFNELYRLTRDRAYFVAYSVTGDEQDALDILQDSYLKAWQSIATLREPERFTAWLKQITGNTAKNFIKQRKPYMFQTAGEAEAILLDLQAEKNSAYIPHAAMDTAETRRLIMEIVDGLPEDQRLCTIMFYYDDMEMQEIAAALEIPLGTVQSRLFRARKKISDGVEALEQSGTMLYGAAPIPLLVWLLHGAGAGGAALPPVIIGGAAAVGGAAAAVVTVPKVIAGIAALAIAVGGTTAAVKFALPKRPIDRTGVSTAQGPAYVEEAYDPDPPPGAAASGGVSATAAGVPAAAGGVDATAPQGSAKITRESNGVIFEYPSGALPPQAQFTAAVGSASYTTLVVNPAADTVAETYRLSCRVNGVAVHNIPGLTIRLPAAAWGNPAQLQVQHCTASMRPVVVSATYENGYFVFTTDYI